MDPQGRVNQLDSAMSFINTVGWICFLLLLGCLVFAACLPKKKEWIACIPMGLLSIPMFPVYFAQISAMHSSFGNLFQIAGSWALSGPQYLGAFVFAAWHGVVGVMVLAVVGIAHRKVDRHANLLREGDRLAAIADHALGHKH